jgi:CO/xanthine dehydrogenase Mo-binding subunit
MAAPPYQALPMSGVLGTLHACFVRSPFARARINGIDTSAALALPGVHAVFTAADLNPDVKEAWHAVAGKDVPDCSWLPTRPATSPV